MCQKAFGTFFAPLVGVPLAKLELDPRRAVVSSKLVTHVERGFCGNCGTPLTFDDAGSAHAARIGSFDEPETIAPKIQYGIEASCPVVDSLASTAGRRTTAADIPSGDGSPTSHHQHPDHDTESWPPGSSS